MRAPLVAVPLTHDREQPGTVHTDDSFPGGPENFGVTPLLQLRSICSAPHRVREQGAQPIIAPARGWASSDAKPVADTKVVIPQYRPDGLGNVPRMARRKGKVSSRTAADGSWACRSCEVAVM